MAAVVLSVSLALGGTSYWALDRYVIDDVQIANVSSYENDNATISVAASSGDGVVNGNTFTSSEADITVEKVTVGDGSDQVTYFVADVELSDATVLRSAFANDSFGSNIIERTSEIASDHDAVLAINGDYYGFRDTGIVIRNGVVYRDEGARDGLVFYTDGTAEIYDETTTTADELLADGAWNTLSFGPALVEDGAIVSGIDNVEIDTNFGNHSIQGNQPRTAVGVIDENHLVFVVVDGREQGYSVGVTMTELAQIMVDLGAETAYNLDGGGSSTMYFDGEVINQPSNNGERGTSDILYIEG